LPEDVEAEGTRTAKQVAVAQLTQQPSMEPEPEPQNVELVGQQVEI
jgi:hypothetical protein